MSDLTVLEAYAVLMLYVLERSRILQDLEYRTLFIEMQLFFDDGTAQSFDPAMLPLYNELAGGREVLSEHECLKVGVAFLQQQAERHESEAMLADIAETVRVFERPFVDEHRAIWEGCLLIVQTDGIPRGVWTPPS